MARQPRRPTPPPIWGIGPFLFSARFDAPEDPTRYPYTVPAIASLGTFEFHPKVTFLVGENGSGKSTFLEAVAVAYGLNPEGGSANFNFATRASHSSLGNAARLSRSAALPKTSYFLRAETFYNVATQVEALKVGGSYGGKPLHEQSHGESFFALFLNRFGPHGLYFLDEPEAALSPARQLQFVRILHDLLAAGCQFVIATHSPIILSYPDARIHEFGPHGVRAVAYEECEPYKVTAGFLRNPAKSLRVLLADGDEAE